MEKYFLKKIDIPARPHKYTFCGHHQNHKKSPAHHKITQASKKYFAPESKMRITFYVIKHDNIVTHYVSRINKHETKIMKHFMIEMRAKRNSQKISETLGVSGTTN